MAETRAKVAVVTGASSGIGRAAAVEFARRGYAVVVTARRREELGKTAELCRTAGGEALVVVADVTREDEVTAVAEQALDRFGRLDVWVNNAGTTLFGGLDAVPFEEHRRVLETNLFGAIFGARAALPIFRRQDSGVLVNVGSILSKVGQPYVPSYVISKFGLRGLSETLRSEFADHPRIHVATVLPYAVGTPHFESGANRIGREAHPMPPLQSAEKVARAIVDVAERPRRERHVPRYAVVGLALRVLFPCTVEKLILHILSEWHFGRAEAGRHTGTLYEPRGPAQAHGTRSPRLSTPALLFWLLKRLPRILGGARAPRPMLGT